MKNLFILAIAFFSATFSTAQVEVSIEKVFPMEDKVMDLNDAQLVKDGIIFVGDTRPTDKIIDGKYRGMRVVKQRRYYYINDKCQSYNSSLLFRRAPQGATREHKVDTSLKPRSCMVKMKPTSNGTFNFCAMTNKPEGNNLYVAVVNGKDFHSLATLPAVIATENVGRKKDSPAKTISCDYTYHKGDEVWIYSDGSVILHAFSFSGSIDKEFKGN